MLSCILWALYLLNSPQECMTAPESWKQSEMILQYAINQQAQTEGTEELCSSNGNLCTEMSSSSLQLSAIMEPTNYNQAIRVPDFSWSKVLEICEVLGALKFFMKMQPLQQFLRSLKWGPANCLILS